MPARILVINDTQEILELFEQILTDEGYEVALYSYGIQDLQEVLRVQPDLIILDYIIGAEGTGWQLLQKLKMTRATMHIPIIVCSAARHQLQEIEGWLAAKGVGVVLKPFDLDDLLLAVHHALERPQLSTADEPEDDAAQETAPAAASAAEAAPGAAPAMGDSSTAAPHTGPARLDSVPRHRDS